MRGLKVATDIKTEVAMNPDILRLARCQRGELFFTAAAPAVAAGGEVLVCHNLRRISGGGLERAGVPAVAAVAGGEPLLADRRDDGWFILRQEDDGCIIVDGYLADDDTYTRLQTNLGAVDCKVEQAVAAGEFVVLRHSDGSLGYLLYHSDLRSYTLLGRIPAMPPVSVSACSLMEFTEPVDAVELQKPVDDIRSGIGTALRTSVGNALTGAWDRLAARALQSGYWLQPVRVCFALRLWDGSLLHVTEEQTVCAAPGTEWQTGGRVVMHPLVNADGKVSGTAASSVTATGYRLEVTPPTLDLGVWNDVVRSVEVWIASCDDPIDRSALPQVAAVTVQHEVCLSAILPQKSPAQLGRSLADAPRRRLNRWQMAEECGILTASALLPPVDDAAQSGVVALSSLRCAALLGHDGFLHLATAGGLLTTCRGNPLCVASATDGDWSGVRVMVAQLWGGGAYTRQIIYVADHRGVTALAHDSAGIHTNCRLIARHSPRDAALVAVAPECVYMLLDNGSLTRFEGTRAVTMLTGIGGCRSIFHDECHGELWLTPTSADGHCVVLDTSASGCLASTRARLDAFSLPGAAGYVVSMSDNGLAGLRCVKIQTLSDTDAACRWLARVPMPRGGSMMRTLQCGVWGGDVDARLRVGLASGDAADTASPLTVTDMRLRGTPRGRLRLVIRPGGTQEGVLTTGGEWRAELVGHYDRFDHISVA